MAFKNALKNLVAHFGRVWSLLLFIVIFVAVISGLSMFFISPIAAAFTEAGVFEFIKTGITSFFYEGNWPGMWDNFYLAYAAVTGVLESDSNIASLSFMFVTVILIFVFRFFLGLYEIPMTTVMDGQMSCNCRYSFGGKFVASLLLAIRYSFAKMVFTVLYDAAIFGIMYGLQMAIGLNIWLAMVYMFVLLTTGSLRFSMVACWAPTVVNGEYGIIKGFFHSVKLCFKRFSPMYTTYLVSFIFMVALGIFITVFTLGVGLILILPFFACYISYLNITEYYNRCGRRYYVDDAVFTPPVITPETVVEQY